MREPALHAWHVPRIALFLSFPLSGSGAVYKNEKKNTENRKLGNNISTNIFHDFL